MLRVRFTPLAVPARLLGRLRQPQAGTGGPAGRPGLDLREGPLPALPPAGVDDARRLRSARARQPRPAHQPRNRGDGHRRGRRRDRPRRPQVGLLHRRGGLPGTPESVDRALSQTTNVRIDVSTPNGQGNPFFTKRHSGKTPVFTFHWRDDPRKGEAWYAEQKRRCDPATLAQEVDIDYAASLEGVCIPAAWVRAAVGLSLPAGQQTVAGLDVGGEGSAKSVLIALAGPVVRPPVAWGRCNTTETAWRARDAAARLGASVVCDDAGGVGAGVKGRGTRRRRPCRLSAAVHRRVAVKRRLARRPDQPGRIRISPGDAGGSCASGSSGPTSFGRKGPATRRRR